MGSNVRGVVAAGHPEVAGIGREVLGAGGNAFDAAVACCFASAVAEPCLTSLGGGGFLLARPAAGAPVLHDFFVDVPGLGRAAGVRPPAMTAVTVRFPSSEQVFRVGLGSVAVPGVLCGLVHVHRQLGRVPLGELVSPAARLARAGVALNRAQAHVVMLLRDLLLRTPEGRALFAPEGVLLGEGDRFANHDLGDFLDQIGREGDREFYEGAIARDLAAAMEAGGGRVTAADLAAFRVVEREPLQAAYRGRRLLTNPPPSVGGSGLARALGLLATMAPAGPEGEFGSPAHVSLLVRLLRDMERVRPGRAAGGTTHASVCDRDGNVASLTTSNGEWSGHVAGRTGVMLNNMLGEDDLHPGGVERASPGERVGSMMAPSMLLEGDRVLLALGSGGSTRIRSALLQVVMNVVDLGMRVDRAVAAPRLHWDGARVHCEPGFPAAARAVLARRWPLVEWAVTDMYFGGVQAAAPDGEGAGDPRRDGAVAVAD